MKISGCELLARSLLEAGVKCVIGRQEGALGPAFRRMKEEGITAITPLGDIAGPFIAHSYTYYTRFPAVVMASTPAEVVNTVAGVGTAWADKIPVFVVSACADHRQGGSLPGRTQRQLLSAFTKWSATLFAWEDMPVTVGQALREAGSGCHGPVHIDIPEGLLAVEREMGEEELAAMVSASLGEVSPDSMAGIEGDPEQVSRALGVLLAAERPLIFSGGGVVHARAWAEMDALVRALEIPASTSMAGEGTVLGDNPCYIGGPSYLGGEAFHRAIKRADCVLVVGSALGGLEGFGQPPMWNPDIRFIQVDIDPVRICLNVPVEISILGDAGAVIRQMLGLVDSGEFRPNPAHRSWLEHLQEVKRRWRYRLEAEADDSWPVLHQGYVVRTVREASDPETFYVIDGGNTALWAGMFCVPHRPNSALNPVGMGTLGSGIPLAMGIKAAAPERPLVVIQGDGSFLYNVQELVTAMRLGMDFVVVILNDGCWNMIKGTQDMFFGGRNVGAMLGDIDYAAVARGFGCYGRRVERAGDLEPAFGEARASGLPAVLDVVVDPDTFPETLASFGVGEFEGVAVNPLRALGRPSIKLDRRLLNRAKYVVNILLDRDLR